MADIKTVTEELEAAGKEKQAKYLLNDEIEETLVIKELLNKIDELVTAVNKLNS
tara:strand:+ start:767 stop:928 length:162 start_codon:yes stop_codon:yes gene_type:complete